MPVFQAAADRTHHASYITLSSHLRPEDQGQPYRRSAETKLVVVLSNYHFNRAGQQEQQQRGGFERCTPQDCSVGLKFSSTDFASKEGSEDDERYFDKHGLLIPYPAFVSLLGSRDFNEFLKDAEAKWKVSSGHAEASVPRDAREVDEEEEEEEDDDDIAPPRKNKARKRRDDSEDRGSKKRAGGGHRASN